MTLSASSVGNVTTKVPDRRAIRALRVEPDVVVGSSSELADVERVTALLQGVQPDLEVWREGAGGHHDDRSGPVWLTVGAVWVSTFIVIALVVGGVAILVH